GPSDAGPLPQHTLHLRVIGNGEARATSFSCRSDCTQTFDASTAVHLVALPDTGWKFDGWQGACAGIAACEVSMTADHDVAAAFSAIPPPPPGNARLTVWLIGNGSGRV